MAGVAGSYKFSCSGKQGAVVVLGDYGTLSEVVKNNRFGPYMAKHYRSWYRFALSKGVSIKEHDIVLVSSWIKTSQWALAAFADQQRSHELSFNANAGPFGAAKFAIRFGMNNEASVTQRRGPRRRSISNQGGQSNSGENVQDQCLFLRYYKLKKRFLLRDKIVTTVKARDALGSPEDEILPPSGPSGSSAADTRAGGLMSRSTSSGSKESHSTDSNELERCADPPNTPDTSVAEGESDTSSPRSIFTELPPYIPVRSLYYFKVKL